MPASCDAECNESSIDDWVECMPERSGFGREEFETQVSEEYSTFGWVIEGFGQHGGFGVVGNSCSALQYAEVLRVPDSLVTEEGVDRDVK